MIIRTWRLLLLISFDPDFLLAFCGPKRSFFNSKRFSQDDKGEADSPSFSNMDSTTATIRTNHYQRKAQHEPLQVLGICGGIGSGKSAACRLLVDQLHALAHIDTDSIAHSVYDAPNSPVVDQVVQAFGDDIRMPDGIDRKKLGSIVFADRSAMQQLEGIVWPHVQNEIEKRIQAIRSEWLAACVTKDSSDSNNDSSSKQQPIIVVEAAVLLDAGWQDAFLDAVWVVTVPQEVALQRIMRTRGLSRHEAVKRVEAQQSRRGIGNIHQETENGVVTATIDNSGTLEELEQSLALKLKDPSAWYKSDL